MGAPGSPGWGDHGPGWLLIESSKRVAVADPVILVPPQAAGARSGRSRMAGMGTAADDAPPRTAARSGLPVTAGILAGGVALSAGDAVTGVGIPCPFRAITGWLCPLCGGTRMGEALLHGDVVAALRSNPLALVAVAGLAVLTILWTVELLGGPRIRLPERLARRLRSVPGWVWPTVAATVVVGYAVLRNLL